jgi:hypothetical protein
MKRVIATLALISALILVAFAVGRFATPDYPSLAELEAERLELERMRQLAPLHTFVGAAWAVLPLVALFGGLIYLAALGVAHAARFHRRELVRPDGAGLLPVVLESVPRAGPAALAAFHHARAIEAGRQPVPHSLTYSPHSAPRLDYRANSPGVLTDALDEPAALLPPVLTFGELLSQGQIGRGQPLLLGVDSNTGQTIPGSWLDLYATATAGLPGSGKTTSQRFFAAQTALHGARFVVCDPHAGAADDSLAATLDPLRSVYLVEPESEPKRILEAVRYVAELGRARITGKSQDRTPIILWVDELTSLLGRSDVGDDLAMLLEKIAQEYRKRGVYLSASGQIWTASRTTSELRDSLASVLCHRMKRNQARLLLPTEEAQTVERLETGEAILWRTSGVTTRVKIPNTTAADVVRVGTLLTASDGLTPSYYQATNEGAERPACKPDGSLMVANQEQATTALGSAEAARVVALFRSGLDIAQIVLELRGVKSSEGRKYQDAAREVQALLRAGLGGVV